MIDEDLGELLLRASDFELGPSCRGRLRVEGVNYLEEGEQVMS